VDECKPLPCAVSGRRNPSWEGLINGARHVIEHVITTYECLVCKACYSISYYP